jgi:hypothetical protein
MPEYTAASSDHEVRIAVRSIRPKAPSGCRWLLRPAAAPWETWGEGDSVAFPGAVLTEGGTRVLSCREGFDGLNEALA